jgi:RHS repeat-associated protein
VVLRVSAAAETSVVTYHQDHLGSPAVLTSSTGKLLEERAQYPYGGLRSLHRPTETEGRLGAPGSAEGRWGFTGKERDSESGLVDMGARSYFETAGIFLSPDERYAEVASLGEGGERDQASFAAFLNNPQMGNLYAYGVRNPLKFVDPSGLEIVFSPVLQKSPVFQEALALFKRTEEGQRLLAHIENSKFKVTLSAGKAITTDPKTGKAVENLGVTWHYEGDGNSTIEINVLRHKADYANHDAMILELADTIHHELRHSEGNMNALELAGMRKGLDWIRKNALQTKSPSVTPADPTIWMGTEVHKALDVNKSEPLNVEFRKQADFEQVKDRIQKSGVLLEVDLD